MTVVTGESGIRAIALEQLQVSHTGSQDERRKHFDKAAIAELADSIKKVGLLSPIIARPVARIDVVESAGGGRWYPAYKKALIEGHNLIGGGHVARDDAEAEAVKLRAKQGFEVVAGERRLVAAKAAGLTAISVDVRTLTDEQVLEIQLIENLQREGLHPLAEAEGYQKLQAYGHSADEIADKIGKSKAYVYARLKLTDLGPAAREAFYRGELNASTALLLARIPVASVQREATGEITKGRYDHGPLSFREARDFIEREYMLRLAEAPFPTGNAELLPKAGACGPCPKRTGNQAELFADVKSADVCTDPVCFKLKREAWAKLQVSQAKESGRQVIVGAEAKKIAPYGDQSFAGGFTRLDAKCWEDPKHRTYKQILGKEAAPVLVQLPKGGDLIELVQKTDAIKKLKADGVIKPLEQPKHSSPTASNKIEAAFREALFLAIHAKAPKKLSREVLETVIEHELDCIGELPNVLTKAWGWDADTHDLESLSEPQLNQFLFELCVVEELNMSAYAQTPKLLNLAKSMKIDTKKIRKEISAAARPAKKAKASRKTK
jgi:ParB/RepB/Spo0J family partition protein